MLRFFAHKQTPGPSRMSLHANEKFGVIFIFTRHLWPLPVRVWREHACSWHQKAQGQPPALPSGGARAGLYPYGSQGEDCVCAKACDTLVQYAAYRFPRYHSIPITLARAALHFFFPRYFCLPFIPKVQRILLTTSRTPLNYIKGPLFMKQTYQIPACQSASSEQLNTLG